MFKIKVNPRLIQYCAALGATLGGLIFTIPWITTPPSPCNTEALVTYQKLKPEMTLTDVQSFLGPGQEIESTRDTVTYVWKKTSHFSITVTFEGGKLVSKQQRGCS